MTKRDEVAVVGYACRLPGAANANAFWSLLRDNRCSVSWITPDRFPTGAYYHPSTGQLGRAYTFAAGVVDDVWGFDAGAFGMSPREAEQVDPQHRHLLEVAHDALAHAGIRPSSLVGSDTGVYVGASSVDHAARFSADPSVSDMHMMTGNSLSIMANRISYNLDVRGPSLTVDTACSSSLVALTLAAEAIRNGKIDTAIVAGVNLLLSPFSYVGFSRASMLSPTGLCRPFDAEADGYVRAEGTIVLVLRSMATARKARNRMWGVIVGSGMNQDGRTTGLSLPSADSQRRLLEQVYGDYGVDPSDLCFLEAHGTGTLVGDPIEADALGKGLGQRRTQPLPIGSVKSNVGHLEPVSGLAGVLKSLLALQHDMVPATLHQKAPSPHIPFDELNLRVVNRNWRPPARRGAMLAGVNSFGFGGTNAHVILRSDDAVVSVLHQRIDAPPPPLLLSAHSVDALPILAAAWLRDWPSDKREVNEFISASVHLRDALQHRVIISGDSPDEIKLSLERFSEGADSPAVMKGQTLGTDLPVAFLFSGNGSQWAGMGRDTWHRDERFRDALQDLDKQFGKAQPWSLVDMLFSDDLAVHLRRATYSQPLLLALQIATVRALEERGVHAAATFGHSVGEIAAAWAAGALSVEQAIQIVIARSRHQEVARSAGAMAALMLNEREARRVVETVNAAGVEIAAVNSWRSVTVSGPASQIDKLLTAASELKISARRLDLDYPFHSGLIDPVRGPLLAELAGLKPLTARRPFVSSVTGDIADGTLLDAEHWWRNVRRPVRFEAGMTRLLADGLRVFVEIGPKPVLASYVRDTLREAGERGVVIETLAETDSQRHGSAIDQAVSRIYIAGGKVEEERFFGPRPARAVSLPLYPWQHSQFKLVSTAEATNIFAPPTHPVLGLRPRNDCTEWFSTVDPVLHPWLADHAVGSVCVFPAAAYVDVMLAAARELHGDEALELRDLDIIRPLIFDGQSSNETLLRTSPETGITEFMSRPRTGISDWTLNARGIIGRSPIVSKAPTLQPRLTGEIVVPQATVYEVAQRLGYDYGPAFRRVKHVTFPISTCAVAALTPAAGTTQIIDIAGLDAAFHALFASEEGGVADMPMRRMLPVRFGCVRVFSIGADVTRVVARTTRKSLTSFLVDVELFDESGKLVFLAQDVRLINAPSELTLDPNTLRHGTSVLRLPRAGQATPMRLPPASNDPTEASETSKLLAEAVLLLEAGCLRAAWAAFASLPKDDPEEGTAAGTDDPAWTAYLRSALLWHLEARNLVVEQDGKRRAAAHCDLPEISAIVNSLIVRHPEMANEAAGLARIAEILESTIFPKKGGDTELRSSHWRHFNSASSQISELRKAVVADVATAVRRCPNDHQLRLLMIGTNNVSVAQDLSNRFSNLEITLTDLDDDKIEQVKALLGSDAPRIHCLPWDSLAQIPARTVDLAVAIDALSEAASARGGLDGVARILRPNAPVIAAELAPSIFWDIVRGSRPAWWTRSIDAEFPIGALLTGPEWIDEFRAAGFAGVQATPVLGDRRLGVVVRGVVSASDDSEIAAESPTFAWRGDIASGDGSVLPTLARQLDGQALAAKPRPASSEPSDVTDICWAIDMTRPVSDPVAFLSGHLAQLAELCRALPEGVARLWVVMDFGRLAAGEGPIDQPTWCTLTSAMRVAQNEYSGVQIRCLGLAGADDEHTKKQALEELLSPDDEREIFIDGESRSIIRVTQPLASPTPHREEEALRLRTTSSATRGALVWEADGRAEPGPGEIEIKVAAVGLNFRDVMWNLRLLPEEALEEGYAGAGLGMECAGTVSKVSPDVQGLQPGDRVLAFAPKAFSSHVIVPAFAASRLPDQLSFQAATTVPVAFLTAYYSLVHLAQLRAGETVLIHGGAGAVGLAAIQIARHCGATVIATAGSHEKRALLRSLGVDLACNSRTLSFADEILAHTGGKGVDVVLNSLAEEAMLRSFDCLAPFGRFVELGKRDFFANTHLRLRPLRRNISYFGVDVDQLLGQHKDLTARLFGELLALFGQGDLVPLPYQVVPGERVADAFRLMQRSGHIGKIVVTPPSHATDIARPTGQFPVAAEGVHLVIGGTSGFGLATAEWLADRGASSLILASRSGHVSDVSMAKVETLRLKGLEVEIASVDVSDAEALRRFLTAAGSRQKIKGIVHAAMVIDDRLIDGVDRDSLEMVMQPKIQGALNLQQFAAELDLDYLLLFSSATTLFGNPGQFNYVAANAFLEGLARRMMRSGVPTLAVAWGGIEDVGYLARNIAANANLKKRFSGNLISARTALDCLDWAYDGEGRQTTAVCSIAKIDWPMAKRELATARTATFSLVGGAPGSRHGTAAAATLEMLRSLPKEEVETALLEIVVEEIARVLRLPPKEVDRHRPLAEMGMDSLMMLELRTVVEGHLQVELPMMSLASGISPADVARRIAPLVTGEAKSEGIPSALATLSASHLATVAEGTDSAQRRAAVSAVLEKVRGLEGPL